mgnify:FL=1|tara:strand:- start:481 stop:654 length:174 start_codon:yes stop_codon:yes gene_type:complete
MKRFDYRRQFQNKSIEQLKEMLPFYKKEYSKYLGGHPDNVEQAFKELTFLENKIATF